MKKSILTMALLTLFFTISFVLPVFALPIGVTPSVAAASGTSSCTAANSVKVVMSGGTPDSYASQITVSSHVGSVLSQMDFLSIYPWDVPLGTLYNQSMVDWVSHNANYSQWTVNIKPGLRWSNGSLVTSNDILATYTSSFGLNPIVDVNNLHTFVTSIAKLNSSAVVFNLNQSNAQFLTEAGAALYANIMPAAYANLNFTGEGINETVLGPYYPYNGQPGSTVLTMYRNPYFYTTGVPEPLPCALDLSFVEATSNVENAMLSGQFDFGYVVDPGQVPALIANPNLHIFVEQAAGIQSIIWNATTFPFNMTQFRQAVAYSINYDQVVQQALDGYGTSAAAAQGTVTSAETNLYNANQQSYATNTTTAISLLKQIGITPTGPNGQMQYSNGQPVTLTLFADSSYASDIIEAGIISQNLGAIGISVSVQTVSHSGLSQFKQMPGGDMFLSLSNGVDMPLPFIDASPPCSVFTHPHDCVSTTVNGQPYYIEVAQKSFNDNYNSNLTALTATSDPTLLKQYLNNIQALNAQYLPVLIVAYPDQLGVYSTARWTGWANGLTYPSGWFDAYGGRVNTALWSGLSQVGASGTASTITATATATATITQSATVTHSGSVVTSTASGSVVTQTASKSSVAMSWSILAVLLVIVLAAAALIAIRRPAPRHRQK